MLGQRVQEGKAWQLPNGTARSSVMPSGIHRSSTRAGQEFPWTRLLEGEGTLGSQGRTRAIRFTLVSNQRLRRGTARHGTAPPAMQHPGCEVEGGISTWKNLLEVRRADGKALFICNCRGKTNKAKNLPRSLAL